MKKAILSISIIAACAGGYYFVNNKVYENEKISEHNSSENFNKKESITIKNPEQEVQDTDDKLKIVKERLIDINKKRNNRIQKITNSEENELEKLTEYDFVYSDYENKRIEIVNLEKNIEWNQFESDFLKEESEDYLVDLGDENNIERISFYDFDKVIKGIEQGLVKEIEMPINRKSYTYKNCTKLNENIFTCRDIESWLSIIKKADKTIQISQTNKHGRYVGVLKEGKGYILDLSTTEVIEND